jgi:1,2-diacylglycerol 3-beta-galactosyltransferase
VLTDLADYPPHFWMERQKQFLICGSEHAMQQARSMGHEDAYLWRTSGMILNPRFYDFAKIDRPSEAPKIGLDANRMTGLVLFGGQGCRQKMLEIDRLLGRSGLPVQLILICGKNQRLEMELRARSSPLPRVIEGFTDKVSYYMQLADFFIGKPGPGSLAEATMMGLPVFVERNAWTLPQERYNTDWVREKQVGVVLNDFSQIAGAVAQLLEPCRLDRFRANAAAMRNRAVFEIADILERILEGRLATDASPSHAGAGTLTN